jgi:hypothetical protein
MIITSRNTVRIIADARKTQGLFERALHSELFIAVAAPLLLLLIWEIVVRIHLLDARFFPAPSSVIEELIVLLQSGLLFIDIGWTLLRVLIGTLLGTIRASSSGSCWDCRRSCGLSCSRRSPRFTQCQRSRCFRWSC